MFLPPPVQTIKSSQSNFNRPGFYNTKAWKSSSSSCTRESSLSLSLSYSFWLPQSHPLAVVSLGLRRRPSSVWPALYTLYELCYISTSSSRLGFLSGNPAVMYIYIGRLRGSAVLTGMLLLSLGADVFVSIYIYFTL